MAGPYSIFYDPTQDAGERLAPEIREEIAEVAPSTVTNGSISEAKLAENSVTTGKILDETLTEPKYATGSVSTRALANDSVTTSKIADDSVTPAQTATGVVTAVDNTNASVECVIKFVTAAEFAALTPDPNALYFISA